MNKMKIGLAQIAPVWLNKKATLAKILTYCSKAKSEDCDLVIFGEALLPGYPFWLSYCDGAKFNSKRQKEIFAHYLQNAVNVETDLKPLQEKAKEYQLSIYIGVIEKAIDRGGHSLYCSLVFIDKLGEIKSVHRKLQPTYEERLVWGQGDGHGLVTHEMGAFKLGGLNCWENWMPLARTALYAQGENVHVAVWPGCLRNTTLITPFIAQESRSYSIAVSSLFSNTHITDDIPHADFMREQIEEWPADGGSCIANPDGSWLVEPVVKKEMLITAMLDFNKIAEERQNFDPSGHYSRPDITKLIVNRKRQSIITYDD